MVLSPSPARTSTPIVPDLCPSVSSPSRSAFVSALPSRSSPLLNCTSFCELTISELARRSLNITKDVLQGRQNPNILQMHKLASTPSSSNLLQNVKLDKNDTDHSPRSVKFSEDTPDKETSNVPLKRLSTSDDDIYSQVTSHKNESMCSSVSLHFTLAFSHNFQTRKAKLKRLLEEQSPKKTKTPKKSKKGKDTEEDSSGEDPMGTEKDSLDFRSSREGI